MEEMKTPTTGPGLPKGLGLVIGGALLAFFSCLGGAGLNLENLFWGVLLGGALVLVGTIVFFITLWRKP
jgi:hypothetical protein